MCDWLGLVLEPERAAPNPRAPDLPTGAVATIVRRYQPATADLWRLGGERLAELRLQPELVGDLLEVPDVL
jgi:hypothetical protein